MLPELFRVPYLNFTLATYGLMMAIAFIVGLYVTSLQARNDERLRARVYDLGLYVLIFGLIASKILMVVTEWSDFRDNPSLLWSLDFFRSGGVFYGGFLGGLLAAIFFINRWGLSWWGTMDAFAPGLAIGHMFGRIGCFSAGCCWGKPTASAIGMHFSERGHDLTGVPTTVAELGSVAQRTEWEQKLGSITAPVHLIPTQLIEAISLFVIFITLIWMAKRKPFSGQIVLFYALMYAVARFTIEFWRDDPRGGIWFLSTSQFIALFVAIFSIALLFYKRRHANTGVPVGKAVPAA
ncbi:MAG TPA: prolipoprotein diacylglyceryl transferase [Blastocatellia bacterium]|nr:prolipoprotein diacylglyceryl transferase [Blastocatellia bacterium]